MSADSMMGAGAGLGVVGSLISGQQTAGLLDAQAQLQRTNATNALYAAKVNADRQSILATKKIGSMTADYGASGVDATSGSVLAAIGASAGNAELDRQNIIHGGDLQAIQAENQASLDERGASNAITASYWNGLGGLAKAGAYAYGNSTKATPKADDGDDG